VSTCLVLAFKRAKKELHEANQSKEMEVSGLKGQLRLTQTELSSARVAVAQKEKEVKELSNIVEELLQSMGMKK
jgi:hypothetical protein